MRLDLSLDLPYSREDVFRVYRDHLPDLVPYLPSVRSIEVTSRAEEGKVLKLVNHWKGGGDIPSAARRFISEDLLEWDDYATWDGERFTTQWKTVVPALKDAVDAGGLNTYEPITHTSTRYQISGEIKVDASKIRGVPRFLAGTAGPLIESFLVASIKPNLVAVARGVEKFLETAAPR